MPTKKPDPEGKVLSKDPTKGKKKPAAPKKRKPHYVDNKKFLESIIVYKNKVKEAEASGNTEPRIDEYLGECFLKIATHLSFRPNFINYMYKDDMIADGYENCVQYIKNFNPEKSKNPFAYFTQIVYYAFLRRIAKEKRQMDIKDKIIDKYGYSDIFTVDGSGNTDYNAVKNNIQIKTRRP